MGRGRKRRKHDRWRQVHRWLMDEFPVPRPVDLKIARMPRNEYGDCERVGPRLVIRINASLGWRMGNDILMHEYAHAMTWPLARVEDSVPHHSDEWGLAFARLYRAFDEEDGDERADSY